MRNPRLSLPRWSALLIVGLVHAALARAQAPIPVGSELQVNSYTLGEQLHPGVAARSNGDFTIVWSSYNAQDGAGKGVFARRFSSSGAGLGAEFQVNSYTNGNQSRPVAAGNDGGFVVVWPSADQDGDDNGIFGRRFSSSGTALAAEFQVNVHTTSSQYGPSVAMAGDGRFVVAWHSYGGQDGDGYGVFARRFDAAGTPLGGEFQVNTRTTLDQTYGVMGFEADGDFVVTWASNGQDGSSYGIFARRFDSAGAALGDEFQVNSYTPELQFSQSIAVEPDGDFVIVWRSDGQDGDYSGVFAQRFASSGSAVAAEFQVNTATVSCQQRPAVVRDSSGFVIAWDSFQDGSNAGVFARRFDAAGIAVAAEFQVNTHTVGGQARPTVGSDGGRRLVIAWGSTEPAGDPGDVFAQRLLVPAVLDIDGDGSTDALTDGLLVLRYHFGFTGATLINGALSGGCTRCTAPAIIAYLQSID